ncbi:DUF1289 domain-containing protein [Phaeovulum vinaykumarii]|uniref:DUF1289 domain-containing protein n=1 Tax=Phaeovulum vinaykumarii TaxID=407234 RepID=A0A1N7JQJ9_9RHOB|nr:DUF1289 domain-containing protein [Phaeovulum vinaykumarii]SIS51629.1 hypothetical protein SAMN05421795_101249 [Phaeovulum vinaykumarii]SOB90849.1 hypothetical protein SAMN05878426_101249 [Phaeovulum vinaykumarii]
MSPRGPLEGAGAGDVDSPCVKLCTIHPETRLCLGCKRTIEEIGAWRDLSPEARRKIMAELPARVAEPRSRRGGAAARRARARGDGAE